MSSSVRSAPRVLNESTNESRVRIPRRVVREDTYERVVVVPEVQRHEEFVEDEMVIRDRVVEVAKPIVHQKVVEVPHTKLRERPVTVPEVVVHERLAQLPRPVFVDKPQYVPKLIEIDKIIEVPQTHYREVPQIVQVPVREVVEQIVVEPRPVPQYVERISPELHNVTRPYDVPINTARAVEHERVVDLSLPRVLTTHTDFTYRVILPKFQEVPVPRALLDEHATQKAQLLNQVLRENFSPAEPPKTADETHLVASRLANDTYLPKLPQYLSEYGSTNLIQNYLNRDVIPVVKPDQLNSAANAQAQAQAWAQQQALWAAEMDAQQRAAQNAHQITQDNMQQAQRHRKAAEREKRRNQRRAHDRSSGHQDRSGGRHGQGQSMPGEGLAESISRVFLEKLGLRKVSNESNYSSDSSGYCSVDACHECQLLHEHSVHTSYLPPGPRFDPHRWLASGRNPTPSGNYYTANYGMYT